jgi:hypothetical protein
VGIPEPPGTTAIAAGLSKTFHLTERMRLRFESTFTNLLNHSTFATPPTNVTPRPSALSKAFNRRRTAEIERAKFPCVWTFEDLASCASATTAGLWLLNALTGNSIRGKENASRFLARRTVPGEASGC